jgi:hypothetical protein
LRCRCLGLRRQTALFHQTRTKAEAFLTHDSGEALQDFAGEGVNQNSVPRLDGTLNHHLDPLVAIDRAIECLAVPVSDRNEEVPESGLLSSDNSLTVAMSVRRVDRGGSRRATARG